MSIQAAIADAVVVDLAAHTPKTPPTPPPSPVFGQAFTPARLWRPVFDRKDLATLHVTVVPRGLTRAMVSRSQDQNDARIDVAVQHAPDPLDDGAVDALANLVEQLAAFLHRLRPTTYSGTICTDVALAAGSEQGFILEHMDQYRLFTSVLSCNFRLIG